MKKSVRDALWAAGGNSWVLLAGIPLGLITPKFLAPSAYAILAIVDWITELLKHYHLGTHWAVTREIPGHRERGDEAAIADARDATWTLTAIGALPVMFAPAALARWAFGSDPEFQLCLLLGCVAAVAYAVAGVYQSVMKGERMFRTDSTLNMIAATVPLATLVPCLWAFGTGGYFLSNAIVAVVTYFLYASVLKVRFRLRLPRAALRVLLAVGLPALAIGLIETGSASAGRIVLEPIVTAEFLGLYFFAFKLTRYLAAFPLGVARAFLPHMLARLARASSESELFTVVTLPSRFVGQAVALLIGGAVFLVPALVRWVYRDYVGSIPAIEILFVGAYWPAAGILFLNHLLGTKRWAPVIAGYILGIAGTAVGLMTSGGGQSLATAAAVTAAGIAAANLVFMGASLRVLAPRLSDIPVFLVHVGAPFLLLVAVLWGLRRAEPWFAFAGHPMLVALLQAAAFAAVWSPLPWIFWKRHGSFLRVPEAPPVPVPGEEPPTGGA